MECYFDILQLFFFLSPAQYNLMQMKSLFYIKFVIQSRSYFIFFPITFNAILFRTLVIVHQHAHTYRIQIIAINSLCMHNFMVISFIFRMIKFFCMVSLSLAWISINKNKTKNKYSSWIFFLSHWLITKFHSYSFPFQITMKAEEKNPLQRVRIAILGSDNVGKSGKFHFTTNDLYI